MNQDKPNRRFQFSLRMLFALTTFCAIVASLVATFRDFFVEDFFMFLLSWLILYLPTSLILCGPIWWFGRNRVSSWHKSDFLVLVVPYLTWATFMVIDDSGKSFSILFEPFYLALASVFAPLTRVAIARTASSRLTAFVTLFAVCIVAIMLWTFVPGMRK